MNDFINEAKNLFFDNGLVIILACTIIGLFVKGTIKKIPNKFIPYINMGVSIILGFLIPDTLSDEDVISKVIELAFIGLSSTGLYEALCIVIKKRFSIDIPALVKKYYNTDTKTIDKEKALEDAIEILKEYETTEDNTVESTDETDSQEDTSDEEDN